MRVASLGLAIALCLAAGPAAAELSVRFIEGAPKDRFEIVHRGACALARSELTIDLGGSAAGLIFDVTGSGAGVEVFQPFELVAGAGSLDGLPQVRDGDTQLVLSIRRLAPGAQVVFTIDVDDTLGSRGITVAGSEIEGAIVRVAAAGATFSARFSRQGEAVVDTPACV